MKLIEKAKEELVEIANEQGYWGFLDYVSSEEVSGILEYSLDNDDITTSINVTLNGYGFIGSFMFGLEDDNTFKGVE